MIEGTLAKPGPGGGGAGHPPGFRVTVPSVDVDWEGFTDWNHENDEDTRHVIVPFTNCVPAIRRLQVRTPYDDYSLVHPIMTLHWVDDPGLSLSRENGDSFPNGGQIDSRIEPSWPIRFRFEPFIPKLVPTFEFVVHIMGEADKETGETAVDTIRGRVVNVDLDVDANYDGKITNVDEPLEENPGGLVCVCTNTLTPITLKLEPVGLSGKLTLSANVNDTRIKVWSDNARTKQVILPNPVPWTAATLPGTLYVEGISASATARDVELRLEYNDKPAENNPLFKCADIIRLTVIKVDITQVVSDQISGVEVNALPTARAANNPMIMGTRNDNEAYLRVAATVKPPSLSSRTFIGVRKHGTTTILDCHTASVASKTPLNFDADARELYEIVGGVDMNDDGQIDNGEICVVFSNCVRTITNGAYESDRTFLWAGVLGSWLAYPTAASLLTSFLIQSTPSQFSANDANVSALELTHPLGAHWNSSGTATCRLYSHSNLTTVLFATDFRNRIVSDAGTNYFQEIQDYFNTNTNAQEALFGPWSFSFPQFTFESNFYGVDSDLRLAFHGVSGMHGAYRLRVRRDMTVSEMCIDSGQFTDTYDFDYTAGGVAQSGATVEAGFDTLGIAGRVFKLDVSFSGCIFDP